MTPVTLKKMPAGQMPIVSFFSALQPVGKKSKPGRKQKKYQRKKVSST